MPAQEHAVRRRGGIHLRLSLDATSRYASSYAKALEDKTHSLAGMTHSCEYLKKWCVNAS
jgi:hypothetical protein